MDHQQTSNAGGRRLSGVGNVANRLSQRVTTVLQKNMLPGDRTSQPVQVPQQPSFLPVKPIPTPAATSSDTILDQIRYYEKEGFIPPRLFRFKRVSVTTRPVVPGNNSVSFSLSVYNSARFEVIIDNGVVNSNLETCLITCKTYEELNEKGKRVTDSNTGIVSLPVFRGGSSMGGWLPHYAVGVLIYLLLRLVEDEEGEIDVTNAAIGPYGFELSLITACSLNQGKRGSMEDYKLSYPIQRGIALFGVFDGHGGFSAAENISRTLPLLFHTQFASPMPPIEHNARAIACRKALKLSIEEVDRKFLIETKETSGTTACVVAIDVDTLVVHVANVGDSRCTMCRDGRALDLSTDHKASHPAEIARIVEAGGFVARGRALGLLAISRAIGDRDLKRPMNEPSPITAEADVDTFVIDPCRDEFIVIACDGLFDVMTSQQVVAFVRNKLAEGCTEDDTVNALANHAINTLGSLDNVTIILICLSFVFYAGDSIASTPRSLRAPTIRRSESATVRAAKASASKRQNSRISSAESVNSVNSVPLLGGLLT